MNTTIKIIQALAVIRAAENHEAETKFRKAIETKSRRWESVLRVLNDYAQSYPGAVEIEFDESSPESGPIAVYLRNPNRRLLLADNSSWSSGPCILERRNGYPLARAESPAALLNSILEILADHLNDRAVAPVELRKAA